MKITSQQSNIFFFNLNVELNFLQINNFLIFYYNFKEKESQFNLKILVNKVF